MKKVVISIFLFSLILFVISCSKFESEQLPIFESPKISGNQPYPYFCVNTGEELSFIVSAKNSDKLELSENTVGIGGRPIFKTSQIPGLSFNHSTGKFILDANLAGEGNDFIEFAATNKAGLTKLTVNVVVSNNCSEKGYTEDYETQAINTVEQTENLEIAKPETRETEKVNEKISFFVTSRPFGDGGNLGGLIKADEYCQELGNSVVSGKTWKAYLSTSSVNAKDRIGKGPWYNSLGDLIAQNVENLHTNGPQSQILTEIGTEVPANEHDVITGSSKKGTNSFSNLERVYNYGGSPYTTSNRDSSLQCDNWTNNGAENSNNVVDFTVVGHTNWDPENPEDSWNSDHVTGCDSQNMNLDLGNGRIYCFAEE